MLLLLQDSLRYGIIGKATIPMPVFAVYEKDIVLNDNIEQAGFIWKFVTSVRYKIKQGIWRAVEKFVRERKKMIYDSYSGKSF